MNSKRTRAVIRGVGHGLPDRIMTNKEFEALVETSDEWITQRTGIRERRVSGPHETSSVLATLAAKEALAQSGIPAEEIELVVCGTVTGDMPFPATSCLIQDRIGAKNAGAYDLGAACAGFIYSLSSAAAMVEAGVVRNAVVVGVDTLTKFMDWKDRSTCVLFGDGAGAVVIEREENTDRGLLSTVLLADGSGAQHIRIDRGGSLHPMSDPNSASCSSTIYMAGAEVYRFAVGAMGDACVRLLDQVGLTSADVDLFVPHQANLRIIESAAKRLSLPDEKVFINVDRYGNTSGGSIPLGLYEAATSGRLKPGSIVMTVGFGAGLVWGANLIRW